MSDSLPTTRPADSPRAPDETHERRQSLWLLTVAPGIWSLHFLACYITAAIYCAKAESPGAALDGVRVAIGAFTVVALIGIGVTGWIGWGRHTFGSGELPHDMDTPEDRHRFLGFATVLLAALSAVATIFVALVAVFVETCH